MALSCQLQLSWHLAATATAAEARAAAPAAAAALAAAAPTGRAVRNTKAARARAAAEQEAKVRAMTAEAGEAATAAALLGARGSLHAMLSWADEALPLGVPLGGAHGGAPTSTSPRALGVHPSPSRAQNVEPSPGEARAKTRPRTGPAAEISSTALFSGLDAAEDGSPGAQMSSRILMAAWLAEASSVGLLDGCLASRAAEFVGSAVRAAAAEDGGESTSLAQLVPHACRLVLHLAEPSAAEAATDGGGEATPATPTWARRALFCVVARRF